MSCNESIQLGGSGSNATLSAFIKTDGFEALLDTGLVAVLYRAHVIFDIY